MSYPTIDQPTTDLDEQGLPYQGGDAPLAAFGGRTAQALGDARDLLALGADQYRRQLMQHQLLAHESAANDALNQYRLQGDALWRQYGGTRQREAVEGHDSYQQGLQGARAQAQQGLSAASLALLREALHNEHQDRVRLGEAHRAVQDQAWSDQSSLDTLGINKQAAVLHRDDPARVQALAQRGDGPWLKLGERRGWSDRQIGEQVRAWRGQLYGAVIDQQLHEGNVAGATTLLARVQGELDPPTADDLGGRIVLANAKIQDQRNAPVVVPDAAGSDVGVGGGEDSVGGGDGDRLYGGDGKDTLTDDANAGAQLAQGPSDDQNALPSQTSDVNENEVAGRHEQIAQAQQPMPGNKSNKNMPRTFADYDLSGLLTIDQGFKDAIANEESLGSGDYTARNPPNGGNDPALGRYQMQKTALIGGGMHDRVLGDWNGAIVRKFDVHSEYDFRHNPPAQEAAFAAYAASVQRELLDNKLHNVVGQPVKGRRGNFEISFAGLIAAAHREGVPRLLLYVLFERAHGWDSAQITPENIRNWYADRTHNSLTDSEVAQLNHAFTFIEQRLQSFSQKSYWKGSRVEPDLLTGPY